jgi:hypothetical protein
MFISNVYAQDLGNITPSVKLSASELIAAAVQIALAAAGLIFFAMLFMGGLKYLTAGGDEKAAASARATLTQAFIGLVIVVAAFLIAQLLFSIFKLEGLIRFTSPITPPGGP